MVQAAAGKGGRGGGEEVEDEGGRGHWCRPWVDPGTRVSPMVMDCVVDLLISKPPPCLSGECWRQTATFLARKVVVVVTRHRRVEEEERLKRNANAKCNVDCHNDHHIVGVDLQLPACVEE